MGKKRSRSIAVYPLITLGAVLLLGSILAGNLSGYTVDTIAPRSFYLEDRKSSEVIVQKNQDGLFPAASTIKLIAVMVARESARGDRVIRISRAAALVEPTKINLRAHERFLLRDLVSAMVIRSANDAALAVAMGISGSEREFVKRMNEWCVRNGVKDTRIFDSTGLSRESVSSARSLSRIFRIFISDGENLDMLKRKRQVIRSLSGREIDLQSSNNLSHFRDESGGALIGKTGFTRKAKYCFTGMVSYLGHDYFISIMGADMAWHEVTVLMDYANDRYSGVR